LWPPPDADLEAIQVVEVRWATQPIARARAAASPPPATTVRAASVQAVSGLPRASQAPPPARMDPVVSAATPSIHWPPAVEDLDDIEVLDLDAVPNRASRGPSRPAASPSPSRTATRTSAPPPVRGQLLEPALVEPPASPRVAPFAQAIDAPPTRRPWGLIAAGLLVGAMSGGLGYYYAARPAVTPTASPAPTEVAIVPDARTSPVLRIPDVTPAPKAEPIDAASTATEEPIVPSEPAQMPTPRFPSRVPADPDIAATRTTTTTPPVPAPATLPLQGTLSTRLPAIAGGVVPEVAPPAALPSRIEPAPPREAEPAPSEPEPARSETSASTAATASYAVTPAAMAPAPPNPEAEIREALSRYRAAYDGLDATAARVVWPSVDERALARAFSGLRSQRIEFDRCQISASGGTAKASCTGTTTFVPRVGRQEPMREARSWAFTLQRASEGWQIASAQVSR
jgi:hypothetical protein